MLADAELAQDFTELTGQYRELIDSLLGVVGIPGTPVEVAPVAEGNFRGYDGNQFYVVQRGSINAHYQGKTVYTLEEGDILLGLDKWETLNLDNVTFVLTHKDLSKINPVRVIFVRDGKIRESTMMVE